MEPRKMTLEQLDREQVVHLKKENEKLIERISELEAQVKWTKFDPSKVNTYEEGDIIHVYINGLLASETEYTLNTTSNPATITVNVTKNGNINNIVEIIVMKSKVGDPSGGGGASVNQMTVPILAQSTSTTTAQGEVN